MKTQRILYVSLGSNQGNKLESLQKAIDLIAQKIGIVLKIGAIYKTPALGFNGDDFLNTCVKVSTYVSPKTLIKKILNIEKKLGRLRDHRGNYVNRTIDIDVLLIDDGIIFSKELIVPHPRMLARKFVLFPLFDIASNIIHPIEKRNIQNCLETCSDVSEIEKIKEKLVIPIP
jgi:2-amino-4-hydroxy-6-hydroxymethyldihydropteridine diphosphokinase